jgi:general secretion pathway protein G
MIELILSTLAEFGLINQDYKHRKRISKKEKENGIKRPIKKYLT